MEVIIMLQHGIIIITWKWWLRDPMIKLLREDKYHFTIRYHDYHMISLGYHDYPRKQGSWGLHGAHLGPTGPRWAPCWPHEPCYQGRLELMVTLLCDVITAESNNYVFIQLNCCVEILITLLHDIPITVWNDDNHQHHMHNPDQWINLEHS